MKTKKIFPLRKKLNLANSSREDILPMTIQDINNYAKIDKDDASRILLNKENRYYNIEKF